MQALTPEEQEYYFSREGQERIDNPYYRYRDTRPQKPRKFKFNIFTAPEEVVDTVAKLRLKKKVVPNEWAHSQTPEDIAEINNLHRYFSDPANYKIMSDFVGEEASDAMRQEVADTANQLNEPDKEELPYAELPVHIEYNPTENLQFGVDTSVGFGGNKGEAELSGKDKRF
jgi:hypothetical protein